MGNYKSRAGKPTVLTVGVCQWGMKMIDNMYSFVTSGIGVYGPDMRVGTNSEVMVIDVHFE